MKLKTLLATSACALVFGSAVLAQDKPSAETILATVNGVEITLGHVIALTTRLPEQYQTIDDAALFNGVLDQLIHQTAISTRTDATTKAMQLAIANETRALLAGVTLDKIGDAAATDALVEQAYTEQYLNAPAETEYRASHILVDTEEEAKNLIEALKNGTDFAELAKEKSTGPSGANGGDLGWFTPEKMVPEFGNAVKDMARGGISEPIKTQFGWHVIKLFDKRDVPPPPLAIVRESIIKDLKDVALKAAIDQFQADAEINRTRVEIDPSLIRNTDLLK